jgi:DNA-dependent RNA polymerase auxiliary subunit epsilon
MTTEPASTIITPDIETVREILESGDFSRFIGLKEGLHFEAKPPRPFDLRPESTINGESTIKLVVKIVGLANSEGGYVVCGLRETASTSSASGNPQSSLQEQGVVASLDLLGESDAFIESDIKGRLSSLVIPQNLNGLVEVKWWPSSDDNARGVCTIYVPPQLDADKYYQVKVKRTVEGFLQGSFYGVPIRENDKTTWLNLSNEIKLRRAIDLQDLRVEMIDRLQAMEDRLLRAAINQSPISSPLEARLNHVIKEVLDD